MPKIGRQKFNPSLLGIFINPFYFVRRELWKGISSYADQITGKIIDVGCGSKPYAELFKKSTQYIGMEYDTIHARKTSKADAFYSGNSFPFSDNSFDSAVITEVLEHVFDPGVFLAELDRILKPNARILITCPFVWEEHEQPHDYARYSSFGIRHLLEKHGFEILSFKKSGSGIKVVIQILICYFYKTLPFRNRHLRMLATCIAISPLTLLGLITAPILPKNPDLYLSNIVLAKKHGL